MANFIPNFSTSYGTSSENDDEAILNGAAILLFAPEAEQYDGPLIKVPCRTGDMPGWKWVQELILGHPLRILENCRITVDNFMRLCDILVQNNYVPQNPHKHVSIEESLAMTLVMLSHSTRTRVVAERFQHSTETIHRNVAEVLLGLCRFAQRIIRPRQTNDVHPKIRYSTKYYPWFKTEPSHAYGAYIYQTAALEDAIGAMDGTHIPASVPTNEQMAYTNRHGTQSQNVLAVCDHDMRFVYVYAGWEGSAHDARVFESALRMHTDFPIPPPGKYYLVDAAYKMMPGFLEPFKGGRVSRVGQGCGRGQGPKELFNTRHSQLRNVVERSFGVLKQRFAYLKGPVPYSYMQTQINVVIACCALHNFLRETQPSDDHFLQYEQEDIQVQAEAGGNPYPNIQPLVVPPHEIAAWKAMREEMANQMHASSRRRRQ
nr:uncharacterized protein LOC113728886 [Coffea arabica]